MTDDAESSMSGPLITFSEDSAVSTAERTIERIQQLEAMADPVAESAEEEEPPAEVQVPVQVPQPTPLQVLVPAPALRARPSPLQLHPSPLPLCQHFKH